jgi:hypothetical protein
VTPPRQVWLFQLGCWAAFATAVLHLVGHLMFPNQAGVSGIAGRPPGLFLVPGQDIPTPQNVANGFSLSWALLLATLASAGLAVAKRGYEDTLLLRGVARAYAFGGAVLLVISVQNFFSLQSFLIAIVALCFALAMVPET